jgi:hypothetical protein
MHKHGSRGEGSDIKGGMATTGSREAITSRDKPSLSLLILLGPRSRTVESNIQRSLRSDNRTQLDDSLKKERVDLLSL